MKVSERTKWILTLGILAILLIGAGVYYGFQARDNGELDRDLQDAQAQFIKNSALHEQYTGEIEEAGLDTFQLALFFPRSNESLEIEEALFGAAAEAQVSISTISCSEPKPQTVGSIGYQVFTVNTAVRGTPEGLLRFVGVLGYWLPSAELETVGLNMPAQGESTLSLSISVYTLAA